MTNVVLIPEAMPRASGGTEFIMDALLGAAKMPIPLPTNIRGKASPRKVVRGPICVSITNPTDETRRPIEERSLAPYLSENQPLIGPKKAREAEVGIRKAPAARGVSCIEGP